MNTHTVKPTSVLVIGWSSIIASGIMVLVNLVSLLSFGAYDTLGLNSPLLTPYLPQATKKVMDLYRYSRMWTVYGIFYFLFVLVAGVQFLRLRAWGRTAMEAACWIGLLNAVVDTLLSYLMWQSMQETLSAVLRGLGGGQYSYLNPLRFFTIVAGFFLWVIPCGLMIVFLRRPKIREAVSLRRNSPGNRCD
jgi:hypothetical protein